MNDNENIINLEDMIKDINIFVSRAMRNKNRYAINIEIINKLQQLLEIMLQYIEKLKGIINKDIFERKINDIKYEIKILKQLEGMVKMSV